MPNRILPFYDGWALQETDDTVIASSMGDETIRIENFKQFTNDELKSLMSQCGVKIAYSAVAGHFCLVVYADRLAYKNRQAAIETLKQEFADQINCGIWTYAMTEDRWGRPILIFSIIDSYKVFPKHEPT